MNPKNGRTAITVALIWLGAAFSNAQTEVVVAGNAQSELVVTTTIITNTLLRSNGRIAFTSDRDGNLEIYAMNSDGTGQVRMTNNPGPDCFPAWSPDGSKLAFVGQGPSGAFAIKLMNADGTNEIQLTPIAFSPSPYPWHEKWALSWSPDGAKIAFQENGEIFVINSDGSNRANLTNHPAFDQEPSWSRDGSRILFTSSRVPWITLHTMKADGTDVQALPSAGEYWDMSPDSSPAGDRIAFLVHSEMILPVLYTANTDGTNRQIFDQCGAGMCSQHRNKPKWSPDATKMVFHMWEYFSGDCQIYWKSVSGGGLTQLTFNGRNFQPSWQPIVGLQ
jgi:TolB protein